MPDSVIKAGDFAVFDAASFTKAGITLISPAKFTMSSDSLIKTTQKAYCLLGDEANISVTCQYQSNLFEMPGMGTLTVLKLDTAQQSTVATGPDGKPFILKGGKFQAIFTPGSVKAFNVVKDAMQDLTPKYVGEGYFELAEDPFFVQLS